MWPFFLDRSVSLSKHIRGSVSQVQEILLNADSFIRLNPHVAKVDQDPTNPQRYKVTNRLPGLGHLWEYETYLHAVFTPKDDEHGQGVNVAVTVPQSFLLPKIGNKYRVRETDEPGIVQVTEVVELRALFLLVPYILSTMKKAHMEVLDQLAEVVEAK